MSLTSYLAAPSRGCLMRHTACGGGETRRLAIGLARLFCNFIETYFSLIQKMGKHFRKDVFGLVHGLPGTDDDGLLARRDFGAAV
jgi:hypothetical protein